jgi:hypothetical protein
MLEYAHELKPPFTYGSHPSVRLPINFSVEVDLFRTFYDRIFNYKNPCSNEEARCRLHCISDGVQELCNCSLLGFSENQDNSSVHVCNPFDVIKCFDYIPYKEYYEQRCVYMQCYVPCKEWVYTAQVTMGNLNRKMWEVYEGIYSKSCHRSGVLSE